MVEFEEERVWIGEGGGVGLSKALWSLGYCVYEQGWGLMYGVVLF
jgi:hypothetical protein